MTNNGALVTVCPALFVVVTNTVDCKVVVTSSVGIASVVEVLWLVEVLVGVSGPADVVVDEVDVVGGGVVVVDEVDVVEEVEEVVVVGVVVELSTSGDPNHQRPPVQASPVAPSLVFFVRK